MIHLFLFCCQNYEQKKSKWKKEDFRFNQMQQNESKKIFLRQRIKLKKVESI